MTDYDVELGDVFAEKAALGGMLLSRDVISDVAEIVTADAFIGHGHASIFTAIIDLHTAGEPADMVTVGALLADAGKLVRVGGVPYLHTLMESVPTVANAAYYARMVADHALLRSLDTACLKIRQMIRQRGHTPADLVETARTLVADLAGGIASTDGPVLWNKTAQEGLLAAEEAEERRTQGQTVGTPTGFPDLDRLIHGIQPGKVYVIAGESGSGKSTLAADWIRSATFHHGQSAVYFNLEMSRVEMFNRLACAEANVLHDNVVDGTMHLDDWIAIGKVIGRTQNARFRIDDSPELTVGDIRVRSHRIKYEAGLDIVVVDLIGLVTPSGVTSVRQEQVADISRKLKQLAKELQVAVIVVAQINRGPQTRADKRPSIHDLRESAQIGHDADAVILVHRPDKSDPNSPRKGEADLILDKNRFGPEKTLTVCAQLHYSRFVSIAP